MHDPRRGLRSGLMLVLFALVLPSCQSLREMAALRSVDFEFGSVRNVRLAGIALADVRTLGDLGPLDAARVAAAVATGEVPLSFDVGVRATNPAENATTARLIELDWTLFLEDPETVSGLLEGPVVMPPGETVDIPVGVELDLVRFFDRSAGDLVRLAAGLAGVTSEATALRLEARPTVETPLGPMRYPRPISIVNTRTGE